MEIEIRKPVLVAKRCNFERKAVPLAAKEDEEQLAKSNGLKFIQSNY
jgi:hypothetical protein